MSVFSQFYSVGVQLWSFQYVSDLIKGEQSGLCCLFPGTTSCWLVQPEKCKLKAQERTGNVPQHVQQGLACPQCIALYCAAGMVRVMDNDDHIGPFNIGNPGAWELGLCLPAHACSPAWSF